jgi:hypothetical protein
VNAELAFGLVVDDDQRFGLFIGMGSVARGCALLVDVEAGMASTSVPVTFPGFLSHQHLCGSGFTCEAEILAWSFSGWLMDGNCLAEGGTGTGGVPLP